MQRDQDNTILAPHEIGEPDDLARVLGFSDDPLDGSAQPAPETIPTIPTPPVAPTSPVTPETTTLGAPDTKEPNIPSSIEAPKINPIDQSPIMPEPAMLEPPINSDIPDLTPETSIVQDPFDVEEELWEHPRLESLANKLDAIFEEKRPEIKVGTSKKTAKGAHQAEQTEYYQLKHKDNKFKAMANRKQDK